MAPQIVMTSGSMMPTHRNGRRLAECQRQEVTMPCPLSQTKILPNIVIINKHTYKTYSCDITLKNRLGKSEKSNDHMRDVTASLDLVSLFLII